MSPVFDEQDQLDKVEVGLLEGETVIAVYDGGDTGFIGLTDRRVILQDNAFDGNRSALTSVPYRRIDAVSFVSDTSESGEFTFSPRSGSPQGARSTRSGCPTRTRRATSTRWSCGAWAASSAERPDVGDDPVSPRSAHTCGSPADRG